MGVGKRWQGFLAIPCDVWWRFWHYNWQGSPDSEVWCRRRGSAFTLLRHYNVPVCIHDQTLCCLVPVMNHCALLHEGKRASCSPCLRIFTHSSWQIFAERKIHTNPERDFVDKHFQKSNQGRFSTDVRIFPRPCICLRAHSLPANSLIYLQKYSWLHPSTAARHAFLCRRLRTFLSFVSSRKRVCIHFPFDEHFFFLGQIQGVICYIRRELVLDKHGERIVVHTDEMHGAGRIKEWLKWACMESSLGCADGSEHYCVDSIVCGVAKGVICWSRKRCLPQANGAKNYIAWIRNEQHFYMSLFCLFHRWLDSTKYKENSP